MSRRELALPNLDLDDHPMTAGMWLAKRGEYLRGGQPILEVVCGAVCVEVGASVAGVLRKKLVETGQPLTAGMALAEVECEEDADA